MVKINSQIVYKLYVQKFLLENLVQFTGVSNFWTAILQNKTREGTVPILRQQS